MQARLQNHARASKRPFQELLQYYAMERFLYRLSTTVLRVASTRKFGCKRSISGWLPARVLDRQVEQDLVISAAKLPVAAGGGFPRIFGFRANGRAAVSFVHVQARRQGDRRRARVER